MSFCPVCNSIIKRKDNVFCSRECYKKDKLGKSCSLKTKQKISVSHLGKPMSNAARKHMSAAHKGVTLSEENKINISLANMGRVVSKETRKKLSIANKGNQNWLGRRHTEESKIKMSKAQSGKIISDDQKLKLSIIQKGKKRNLTPEQRAKIGATHIGNKYNLNRPAWNKGVPMCKETKDKIIANWQNPEYIAKQQKAAHNRPNKPEGELYALLDVLFPDTYAYTGDCGFMVGIKNPDFTNMDERKTIDLFGDYFHRNENSQERIDYFAQYGYKTIVIWEHELKNINTLKSKLLYFQYS